MKNSTKRCANSPRGVAMILERKRRTARRDPNEFARFAFRDGDGRALVQAAIHRELQEFLGRHARALVELPRDHGKSVQICVRVLWELGRQPSLRIKLVCAIEALAVERGRFLRDAIANNPRVRMVFPHLVPSGQWSAERFTVRRPAETIGPSVTSLGVGGGSTGARADLLICDDIVDVRAIRSKPDRERVKVYFHENLVNLLEPDGRLWAVFTPWHRDDLNSNLKQNSAYALFRRAIDEGMEPVWPEKWPRERLAERRQEIGEIAFARAYRLLCVADEEVLIKPHWINFWSEPSPAQMTVLAIDPAVSTKQAADASALVTLARTEDGEVRCLKAISRRVSMPDLIALIADADRRHNPDLILFEANAAFQGLYDLLVRQTNFGGKVKRVVQTKDKATRVRLFSVPVENGKFLLHTEGQQELFDEMTTFPVGDHDDLLDAAAMGTAELLNFGEPQVR